MSTRVLFGGGAFLEGPRWRNGRLWFSDMHARQIMTVDLDGNSATIGTVPNRPSGLGWLPDGRLLVVSMQDRRLLRMEPTGLVEHADMSGFAEHECNDMVVDTMGRAYVGHFGFNHFDRGEFCPASILLAEPDGNVRVVADDLRFPNGTVIGDDGHTLIVSESYGHRLTAFDIESDGSLSGRRTWASLTMAPDGICLDADGCVWVASPTERAVVRVSEGGEISRRIDVGRRAIACMLGGSDRRLLFILTSETTQPEKALATRSARIETTRVEVPGAGLP